MAWHGTAACGTEEASASSIIEQIGHCFTNANMGRQDTAQQSGDGTTTDTTAQHVLDYSHNRRGCCKTMDVVMEQETLLRTCRPPVRCVAEVGGAAVWGQSARWPCITPPLDVSVPNSQGVSSPFSEGAVACKESLQMRKQARPCLHHTR